MPSGIGIAGFSSGLAKGLAQVYGQKRQDDLTDERNVADRRARLGLALLPTLLEQGADYNEIQPFVDQFVLGGNGKPKKVKAGEIDPHEMLSRAFAPLMEGRGQATSTGAATPAAPAAEPSFTPATVTADQVVSTGTPAAATTPAATPATSARPSIMGVHLLTPEEQTQREIHKQSAIAEADATARAQRARGFYDQFKGMDPDFELRDALRMAGFNVDINRSVGAAAGRGSDLAQALARKATELGKDVSELSTEEANAAAADFYASKRSMGVNREALSRATFGKAFAQLPPDQQQVVIQKETALLGGHSYATTAAAKEAEFNAPITPTQSATTELPVGTRGPQLAGQQVPTAADRDARRGTENMQTQLTTIQGLLGVLPSENDLAGLVPGASIAIRARSPEYRTRYAQLEAAVDSLVGAAARNLQNQRGAQTEADANRAYSAVVTLQKSLSGALMDPTKGDTQESAAARIAETQKLVKQVLSQLPAAPVPTAPAGKGAGRKTAGAAPYTLTYTGKDGAQKTATFGTQAELDAAKRALGIAK